MLPKDATPEQVTAWRKDNGVPEKAEGYIDALKDVSDGAKSVITPYLGALHEMNLSPANAAKLVTVLEAQRVHNVEARSEADNQLRAKTEDALRADWGNNYRAEINNVHGLLNGAPEGVRNAILSARTPDGNALVGTPEAMRWLAQLARTVNPYSIPVGGDGGLLDAKGVEARVAEIEGFMRAPNGSENYKKYYGNEKLQAEYRTLIDAREQLKKRTAA